MLFLWLLMAAASSVMPMDDDAQSKAHRCKWGKMNLKHQRASRRPFFSDRICGQQVIGHRVARGKCCIFPIIELFLHYSPPFMPDALVHSVLVLPVCIFSVIFSEVHLRFHYALPCCLCSSAVTHKIFRILHSSRLAAAWLLLLLYRID